MVIEEDSTWDGEHTIQYTGDVLQNRTPEILYNFINHCDPNKFNKIK